MDNGLISFPGNAFTDIPNSLYDEILTRHPPPVYLIHEQSLASRLSWLKDQYEGVRLFFPFKSNSVPWIRAKILSQGLNADISSHLELLSWLDLKKENTSAIFNMPAYQIEELIEAVRHGLFIVVNDMQDLDMIEHAAKLAGKPIDLLVRVRLSGSRQSWSRFGASLDELPELANKLFLKSKLLVFKGFHFHLGTNIPSETPYVSAFQKILKFTNEIEKLWNRPVSVFDIGGGVGTPVSLFGTRPESKTVVFPKSIIEELFSLIRRSRSRFKKEIWAEPGRLTAEESAVLMTRVRKVRHEKGIRYAVVDGGINLAPTAGYTFHPVKRLDKETVDKVEWVIFGSSCMEKDIISTNAKLPRDLKRGDILVVGGVGSYDMAMAYPFSSQIPPKIVFMENGRLMRLDEK